MYFRPGGLEKWKKRVCETWRARGLLLTTILVFELRGKANYSLQEGEHQDRILNSLYRFILPEVSVSKPNWKPGGTESYYDTK